MAPLIPLHNPIANLDKSAVINDFDVPKVIQNTDDSSNEQINDIFSPHLDRNLFHGMKPINRPNVKDEPSSPTYIPMVSIDSDLFAPLSSRR